MGTRKGNGLVNFVDSGGGYSLMRGGGSTFILGIFFSFQDNFLDESIEFFPTSLSRIDIV